jgi:predicted  nucleic acid-binding Zn-ribbon protein
LIEREVEIKRLRKELSAAQSEMRSLWAELQNLRDALSAASIDVKSVKSEGERDAEAD